MAIPQLLILLILSGSALKPVSKPSLIYIECELRRRFGVTLGMTRSYIICLSAGRQNQFQRVPKEKKRYKKPHKQRLVFYTGSGSPETLDLPLDPSPRA